MRNFFIDAGRYDFGVNLFNDFLPKRVFAGLVDAKAFNGNMGMSPFNFGTFNLEAIKVVTNGVITPTDPYSFNWPQKVYGRAYKDLNDATDESHGISVQKFLKHSAIFAFDLQALRVKGFIEPQSIGATTISLKFKEPVPPNGLQLIIFGEFNSILALDKTRTITTAMSV
uniref:Uncharacterized protein n=1 Tax=Panagrolaimus superbus TaxID=310955 RepID=A0A914Z0V2_9BILA